MEVDLQEKMEGGGIVDNPPPLLYLVGGVGT